MPFYTGPYLIMGPSRTTVTAPYGSFALAPVVTGSERPLIPESGTVVFHVWTSGTTLIDTLAGNVWGTAGTVTYNAASGTFPKSFSGFSSANYFTGSVNYLSATEGGIAFTFAVIANLTGTYYFSDYKPAGGSRGGWGLYCTSAGGKVEAIRYNGAAAAAVAVTGIAGTNGTTPLLIVGGFDGTNWYMRVNSSSLVTSSVTTPAQITAPVTYIGNSPHDTTNSPFKGKIAEIYVSKVTPTSASLAALYNAVSGALSGAVP